MAEEEKYEQIEKYLAGQMSKEEAAAFEAAIKKDKNLEKSVAFHRELTDTIKGEDFQQFRSTLRQVDQTWKAPGTKAKMFFLQTRFLIGMAATFFLGIVVYQLVLKPEALSANALFAQNFEPYEMVLAERSSSANDREDLDIAMVAYQNRDFQTAHQAFGRIRGGNPQNHSIAFYYGLSCLGAKTENSGIEVFQNLLSSGEHPFLEQSQWYLGLAYLQEGRISEAIKTLEFIPSGAFKKREADELKQKLEKLK